MPCHQYDHQFSRRDFLRNAGCGFGAVALAAMTGAPLARAAKLDKNASIIPHTRGKAKNIIWLFMEGGPSHLDLFDPKPLAASGVATSMETARSKRPLDIRLAAGAQQDRRRPLRHSLLRIGWHQSCRWCLPNEYGIRFWRPTIPRIVGILWARHGEQ
jgi:hypothetical protein